MQGSRQGRLRSPEPANTPVIAIVGGGFCGTTLAIQLMRRASGFRAQIVIIEARAELGAGVAYATRDYPYPLNVAAGQMSLDGANPQDFLAFARAQGINAAAGDYLPRQVYGEYLRARFTEASRTLPEASRPRHLQARVLRLKHGSAGWDLWLDDGSALRADDVVLALGNAPPASGIFAPIAASVGYVEDPWSIGDCAHENIDSVLLVGSGLTMIDAALRLAAIRPRLRHIHVLSRHGLVPESQSTGPRPAVRPDLAPLRGAGGSPRRLTRGLRKLAREVQERGGDWRELFAALRPELPSLWQSLDAGQRGSFLRHLRAYWDVHRHRVPAGPLAAVRALERQGVLDVQAGRLRALRPLDGLIEVQWRPRGAVRSRAWLVDRVVNCTGPDARVAENPDPLVQSLLVNGWIRPDTHGLGIDVTPDGSVVGRDGTPVDSLSYLGPWLRARDWESTAVPELREHAARLAARLAGRHAVALSA